MRTEPGLREVSTNAGCPDGTKTAAVVPAQCWAPSSGALAHPCSPSGDTSLMPNSIAKAQVCKLVAVRTSLSRCLGLQGIMPLLQPLFPPSFTPRDCELCTCAHVPMHTRACTLACTCTHVSVSLLFWKLIHHNDLLYQSHMEAQPTHVTV